MCVILRMKNLPLTVNAIDIRKYFQGLSIPNGGVRIIGGENVDAFILFSTSEDARQAMLLDGGFIKNTQIKLFFATKTEMGIFMDINISIK